jgi:hypothetical protein
MQPEHSRSVDLVGGDAVYSPGTQTGDHASHGATVITLSSLWKKPAAGSLSTVQSVGWVNVHALVQGFKRESVGWRLTIASRFTENVRLEKICHSWADEQPFSRLGSLYWLAGFTIYWPGQLATRNLPRATSQGYWPGLLAGSSQAQLSNSQGPSSTSKEKQCRSKSPAGWTGQTEPVRLCSWRRSRILSFAALRPRLAGGGVDGV